MGRTKGSAAVQHNQQLKSKAAEEGQAESQGCGLCRQEVDAAEDHITGCCSRCGSVQLHIECVTRHLEKTVAAGWTSSNKALDKKLMQIRQRPWAVLSNRGTDRCFACTEGVLDAVDLQKKPSTKLPLPPQPPVQRLRPPQPATGAAMGAAGKQNGERRQQQQQQQKQQQRQKQMQAGATRTTAPGTARQQLVPPQQQREGLSLGKSGPTFAQLQERQARRAAEEEQQLRQQASSKRMEKKAQQEAQKSQQKEAEAVPESAAAEHRQVEWEDGWQWELADSPAGSPGTHCLHGSASLVGWEEPEPGGAGWEEGLAGGELFATPDRSEPGWQQAPPTQPHLQLPWQQPGTPPPTQVQQPWDQPARAVQAQLLQLLEPPPALAAGGPAAVMCDQNSFASGYAAGLAAAAVRFGAAPSSGAPRWGQHEGSDTAGGAGGAVAPILSALPAQQREGTRPGAAKAEGEEVEEVVEELMALMGLS